MPKDSTELAGSIRPTKKQRELLEFIHSFIAEHGYSPSYREIMKGCNYNSVATVALHVNNLIKRGHLQKRDHSARSLEVTSADVTNKPLHSNQITSVQEKWLVDVIDAKFASVELMGSPAKKNLDELYVLVGALRVLGLEGAVQSFIPRLGALKDKSSS